jgi:hypothetical protein
MERSVLRLLTFPLRYRRRKHSASEECGRKAGQLQMGRKGDSGPYSPDNVGFHYLSTVSGGGYIGCWLSAWRYRCEKGISDVLRDLSWRDSVGNPNVSPRVPDAISNLRRSTNYLTPVTGILSPDTWATIVIVARNLVLNHIVIVPLVAAILLAVKLLGGAILPKYGFPIWG